MKAGILFFAAITSLPAAAAEKTVWYDSKGNVALVEKESSKIPEPFIPQWVAREERRDRALKGSPGPRRSRGWSSTWSWAYPTYGSACYRQAYPRCHRPAGWRVIIR
jgi:hypothetical protein